MTEVREKRSLFEQSPNGSPAVVGDTRRKPPPPPSKNPPPASSSPSSHHHHLRNGSSLSPSSGGGEGSTSTGCDKINKLSPALLQRLEKNSNCSSGGLAIKGGIAGAKTPSPAPKKKSKSASKLSPKPPAGNSAKDASSTELPANRLGVGLLASVTKDFSASTGHLDSNSFTSTSSSSYSSSSSSSSHKQTSPHSVRVKSSSPQKVRKAAAFSMDVSKISPPTKRPPRPVSTGGPHRLNPRFSAVAPLQKEAPPPPPRPVSPSGSPSLLRSRKDFVDSFEDSYPPPHSTSPAPQSPTYSNTLTVRQPFATAGAGISRSTENLLEEGRRPVNLPKQRSSSDATSPPPQDSASQLAKRKSKPALPPKKAGLKSAVLAAKPAPPPKPHIKQLKKSPDFNRRVNEGSSPTSPRGPPPTAVERVRSPSATSDPTSPTPGKPRPFSPGRISSPSPAPLLHQQSRSSSTGGGEAITPGASPHPSTPSPRTSQLEGVGRNADSGFVSEAAEDPASPLEAAVTEVWDEARVRAVCVCVCVCVCVLVRVCVFAEEAYLLTKTQVVR